MKEEPKHDPSLLNDLDGEQDYSDIDLYLKGAAEQKLAWLEAHEEWVKQWPDGPAIWDEAMRNVRYEIDKMKGTDEVLLPDDRQDLFGVEDWHKPAIKTTVFDGETFGNFKVQDVTRHKSGLLSLEMKPLNVKRVETFGMGLDPYRNVDEGSDLNATVVFKTKDGITEYLGRPNDIPFPELIKEMVKYYPNQIVDEKLKCYVGIDPGLNGGVVAMTQLKLIGKWIMPLADKEVDIAGLYGLFKDLMGNYNLVVVLEDVHSIYGVSAAANYTFGFVCGAIEAVVVSHKLKLIKVQPKKWQAEIWSNSDKVYKPKKPEQKNPSIDTKGTSLKAAVRLFPGLDLRKSARAKNFHDGIIDGLLLSEYGRRKNL